MVGINDFTALPAQRMGDRLQGTRIVSVGNNIEFISLNEADQKAGLRVNDPGNPGRTYLSGQRTLLPVPVGRSLLLPNWRT